MRSSRSETHRRTRRALVAVTLGSIAAALLGSVACRERHEASPRPAAQEPAPAAAPSCDVLLVYASDERDTAWVRASLARLLTERGVHVCTAEIEHDRPLPRELDRLVPASRYTLPVITPRLATAQLEALQLQMARLLGIAHHRLIPILREATDTPIGIQMLVSLDMTRDEAVVPGVDRLVRTLHEQAPAASPASSP